MQMSYVHCGIMSATMTPKIGHFRWKLKHWERKKTPKNAVFPQNGADNYFRFRFFTSFLQRAQYSHCKCCISYSNSVRLSVRPSVRPSHAGIVSKRRHVTQYSLHRWIAKCVQFCRNQKIFPRDDPFPLKFWLKVTYPLLKAASFDTFCLVAPQP